MDSIVNMILAAEIDYGQVESILSPRCDSLRSMLVSRGRNDLADITHESDGDMLHVTCNGRIWTWGGFDLRYV
jgi:hypothetical protein